MCHAIRILVLLFSGAAATADEPARLTPREALKPFNTLVGSWRALGQPEGRPQEQRKGLWEETIRWEWRFQGDDAWMTVVFDKGKHFSAGTLRYLPDKRLYQLALTTPEKQTVTFTGPLKEHRLILERRDEKTNETQRLVLTFVQHNRYVYHYEVQPANRTLARKVYYAGASKEGVPFVVTSDEIGPLCVVSYGPPSSPITYKGKTYYVC